MEQVCIRHCNSFTEVPLSPWLMLEHWPNAIKWRWVPISALWWKCRAKSLPAEWLGGQNRLCQSPLLPGSLVALVTMPTRVLTQSRVETAGPRRLSNPDSEPTAHFGEQCPQRQLCAFSPPHQIHLEGSFVHVSLAQDAPVLTLWRAYLLFKSLHIFSLHYQNSGCCVCSFKPCLPALLKQGQTVFLITPGWVSIVCIISDVLSIILNGGAPRTSCHVKLVSQK